MLLSRTYRRCLHNIGSLRSILLSLTFIAIFITTSISTLCFSSIAISATFDNNVAKSNLYTPRQQVVSTLLVIGDSLSAGYGLAKKDGWVNILKHRLSGSYYHIEVINASVSGETTFGGLTRTPDLLHKYDPQIVIIELGGNDGLQGLPMSSMELNLDKLIALLNKRGIRVLLVGMKLPPNYGQFYTKTFEAVYQRIAIKYTLEFVPFMLQNIATVPNLMQQDGIHPRAAAQTEILNNIWPYLRKLLPKPRMK